MILTLLSSMKKEVFVIRNRPPMLGCSDVAYTCEKIMPFIHFGRTSKHTSVTLFFLGLSYGGPFENCNEMQTYCNIPFSTNT